jgi:hypothetical protein
VKRQYGITATPFNKEEITARFALAKRDEK